MSTAELIFTKAKTLPEPAQMAVLHIVELLAQQRAVSGQPSINPGSAKGLVTISNGAKCIFIDGFQNREGETLPLMIQKSDGGYNYDTTDMAAIRHRIEDEKADRIIIVTDAGQAQRGDG